MHNLRLIILFSFVLTIIVSRLVIQLLNKTNTLRKVRPHYKSLEVHHITTGIIILLIVGYISITNLFYISTLFLAVFYGIGAGLIIDELWPSVIVQSKHWFDEGSLYRNKNTYLIIVAVAVLLILFTVVI
jgi:hypothetical protein